MLAACTGDRELERADEYPSATVDSILPIAEAIRRFRSDLPVTTKLEGGASSRDELVREFMLALEGGDTATARRLHLTRAEYAYLYFPSSVYMREPYLQPPSVAWPLNAQSSDKGISRAIQRLRGHRLHWAGYRCAVTTREESNSFAKSCLVDYLDPGTETRVTRRLFGAIIERDGQHKFLSYANDF